MIKGLEDFLQAFYLLDEGIAISWQAAFRGEADQAGGYQDGVHDLGGVIFGETFQLQGLWVDAFGVQAVGPGEGKEPAQTVRKVRAVAVLGQTRHHR